jgi:hypothetical protein
MLQYSSDQTNNRTFELLGELLSRDGMGLSYAYKAGICSVMRTVAIKFGEALPNPELILLKLLEWLDESLSDGTLDEDAWMAVSAVVVCGRERLIPYGKRIYQKLATAMENGSLTLVRIGVCVIGDLFHALQSPELNGIVDEALELVFGFLNRGDVRDLLPAVVKALAMIVAAAQAKISEPKRNEIADLLRRIYKSEMCGLEMEDLCRVVFAVIRTYANLFKAFGKDDKPWLTMVSREVFTYVDMIWKMNWFDDGILMELYCLFHVIGETLEQSVNVKLNSRVVKSLIAAGLESNDLKLKRAADVIGRFVSDL